MKKEMLPTTHLWLRYLVPSCVLTFITAAVYIPSLHYDFQFDDVANISKLFQIRTNTFWILKFSGTRWISYWLNAIYYQIDKFNPFYYRIGNVAIHCVNGILVFALLFTGLRNLKKDSFFKHNAFSIALLSMVLFMLHPVQTQTVSYVIQGQLEGLAALGALSMSVCLMAVAYTKNRYAKILFTCLLFFLAATTCGTKEIAIMTPALLMLVDWFFIAQGQWKEFKQRLMLHALTGLIMVSMYCYFLKPKFFLDILGFKLEARNNIGNVITHNPNEIITPLKFFISQFKVIVHYLGIFLWPFNISVEYDWLLSRHFFAPDCILPFTLLAGMGYATVRGLMRNHAHLICFGALWFTLCILPRSSIIPSSELMADYKTYLASVGWLFVLSCALIWAVQWVVARLQQKSSFNPSGVHAICLSGMIIALGCATAARNQVWSSGIKFWGSIIANAPGKARAYNNYGVELSLKLQQFEQAVPYFKKAIAMDSKYPDPCNNLAVAYSHLNKVDLAIEALKQGLSINKYYPEGYNNLASFYLQKKEYDQAASLLKTALQLRPHYGKAHFNLGRVYLEQGDQQNAWECFKNSCTKADLDNEVGYGAYAKMSVALNKFEDAIIGYKKVLEYLPDNHEALFNLGNCLFMTQHYEQSVAMYERLMRYTPNDVHVVYNLGEAYAKVEKYEKAIALFAKLEPVTQQFPQAYLRMASCYDKLGNRRKAQELLAAMQERTDIPAQFTTMARSALAQLKNAPTKVA